MTAALRNNTIFEHQVEVKVWVKAKNCPGEYEERGEIREKCIGHKTLNLDLNLNLNLNLFGFYVWFMALARGRVAFRAAVGVFLSRALHINPADGCEAHEPC